MNLPFLWNVVDNQSQAGSSCRESIDKLLFDKYKCLFASTGSLNFVHSYVSWLLKFTHTSLLHSTQTPRAFDPSAFYFQGEDANVEEMML